MSYKMKWLTAKGDVSPHVSTIKHAQSGEGEIAVKRFVITEDMFVTEPYNDMRAALEGDPLYQPLLHNFFDPDEHKNVWKKYWSKKWMKEGAEKLEAVYLKRISDTAPLNDKILHTAQKEAQAKAKVSAKNRAKPTHASRVQLNVKS